MQLCCKVEYLPADNVRQRIVKALGLNPCPFRSCAREALLCASSQHPEPGPQTSKIDLFQQYLIPLFTVMMRWGHTPRVSAPKHECIWHMALKTLCSSKDTQLEQCPTITKKPFIFCEAPRQLSYMAQAW
jgi:hypothetical protein